MEKFIVKISIICLPILFILISVNYFIDPANLFNEGKYEKGISKDLCNGYHVTNIVYNYDQRLLQKYLIDCLPKVPKTVILGSSRSMLIGSDYISSGLLNSSVSGASIQDFLAIYNLYRKRHFIPETIILGLDPWLLNDNCEQDRWESVANDYYEMLEYIGLAKYSNKESSKFKLFRSKFEKYIQIVSFRYFQQSLLMVGSTTNYYPTKELVNDYFTMHTDGSINYDKKYRSTDSVGIINYAKSYINSKPIYSLGNFSKFSNRNIEILEKFIQYLKEQNVDVVFFLAPYHPLVYDYFQMNNNLKIVLETENYYFKLAKKYNIELIGSFNPNTYKLNSDDFFDGMHCKENAIKIIFGERNDKTKFNKCL